MAAPQRSAEKADRYPYGWWLVFGPSPLLKRGKTDKRSSAQEVEEKKKAKERENQSEPAFTLPLPPVATQPLPASQPSDTPLKDTTVAGVPFPLPAKEPESIQQKKAELEEARSISDSPGSSTSSKSPKKRVHFKDDTGDIFAHPRSKSEMFRFQDPPSTAPAFEALSVASDDSETDVPLISTPHSISPGHSSTMHASVSRSVTQETELSQMYILRPNPEHFRAGEPHVLLILKGKTALREAKKALRDGTWRKKYKESQMYRVLE